MLLTERQLLNCGARLVSWDEIPLGPEEARGVKGREVRGEVGMRRWERMERCGGGQLKAERCEKRQEPPFCSLQHKCCALAAFWDNS
ncbi:hypothetical protein ACOMHN_017960 [Nucella lapillus]